jgi:hypothetical protein
VALSRQLSAIATEPGKSQGRILAGARIPASISAELKCRFQEVGSLRMDSYPICGRRVTANDVWGVTMAQTAWGV